MGKSATKTIEVQGIEIAIPVGSMDRPNEFGERIVKSIQNPTNWKLPTGDFLTFDRSEAEDVAYCLDWYMGGHETIETNYPDGATSFRVKSLGYYHYIGA